MKSHPVQRPRINWPEFSNPVRQWFTNPKSKPTGARESFGEFNPKIPNTGPLLETPIQSYGTFKTAPRAAPMRILRDQNGNHIF